MQDNDQLADNIWQNIPDDSLGGDSVFPTVGLPNIDLNQINTPPQVGQHNLIQHLLRAIAGNGPPQSIQEAVPILLNAIGARGVPLNLPSRTAGPSQFNVNPRTRMNEYYDPGTRQTYAPSANSMFHEPPVTEDFMPFSRQHQNMNVGGRTHHYDNLAITANEAAEMADLSPSTVGSTADELGRFRPNTFDPIIEQLFRPLDRLGDTRVLTQANRTPEQSYNYALMERLRRRHIKPVDNK